MEVTCELCQRVVCILNYNLNCDELRSLFTVRVTGRTTTDDVEARPALPSSRMSSVSRWQRAFTSSGGVGVRILKLSSSERTNP
jgi:hypothetical protein